jgi:hypothetical protein
MDFIKEGDSPLRKLIFVPASLETRDAWGKDYTNIVQMETVVFPLARSMNF